MKRDLLSILVVVALLSPASVALAQEAPAPTGDINPPILKVNDDTVFAAEVSMVMANIAGQLRAQGREAPDQAQLVQMATQRVVEQKLLAQEARRLGYKPNDLRVAEMAQTVEQQGGGKEALTTALTARGSDYDQLMATIREMDLVRTLIAKQVTPTITVTDEEVEAFFAENGEMFNTPAEVRARHIVFAAGETADADTIIAARESAEKARERALAGENFSELALELSQGPSAPDGGDLGWFTYQQMVPPFAEAAFALEPGEISDVIRTNTGFHVIKVLDKKPAVEATLGNSSETVRKQLVQQKSAAKVQELIQGLVEKSTIVPLIEDSGQPAAPADQSQPQ